VTKSNLDGVPFDYHQVYDDPQADYDFKYPIALPKTVTKELISPYRGTDIIAQHKLYLSGGLENLAFNLNRQNARSNFESDVKGILFRFIVVFVFLAHAYFDFNWFSLVTSFVGFVFAILVPLVGSVRTYVYVLDHVS
jgi:hypothetical protein